MKRRTFVVSALSGLALTAGAAVVPSRGAFAAAEASLRRLRMPPLLDTRTSGSVLLRAQSGRVRFRGGAPSPTAGFNQSYLGPTVVMQPGPLSARLGNALPEVATVHWHGLIVSGVHDGGPHSPILPGGEWHGEMQIGQPPATLWYHSHVHGRTGAHVYHGLAGALHLTDGRDDERGLPSRYGVDDLTLIIQDKRFDADGRMVYAPTMTDVLNGYIGNRILVNGQSDTVAIVPKGIARLRLLNASNGRFYTFSFNDGRPLHLIGTDGGFIAAPIAMRFLRLAPGERAECLVDFGDGREPVLISSRGLSIPIMRFAVDETVLPRITQLPGSLDEEHPDFPTAGIVRRRFALNMGGNSESGLDHAQAHGEMPGRGAEGEMVGVTVTDFGINGRSFDMGRIAFEVPLGSVERWSIGGGTAEHPFHVHGVQFRVIREGGGIAPRAENSGWKDTVVVSGGTEILVRFTQPASRDKPYMYHCHILEHEDAGMMGQFAVV